ncbi:hypothetical protein [Kitasatospora sp. NPDC094011]|uniref:hypothetical protein n=1 Tax=Kitasatospora sp. NPDC094011 TaxID=3364090 RepID=UPI00380350B5
MSRFVVSGVEVEPTELGGSVGGDAGQTPPYLLGIAGRFQRLVDDGQMDAGEAGDMPLPELASMVRRLSIVPWKLSASAGVTCAPPSARSRGSASTMPH